MFSLFWKEDRPVTGHQVLSVHTALRGCLSGIPGPRAGWFSCCSEGHRAGLQGARHNPLNLHVSQTPSQDRPQQTPHSQTLLSADTKDDKPSSGFYTWCFPAAVAVAICMQTGLNLVNGHGLSQLQLKKTACLHLQQLLCFCGRVQFKATPKVPPSWLGSVMRGMAKASYGPGGSHTTPRPWQQADLLYKQVKSTTKVFPDQ